MNTEQNYVGRGTYASSTYQAAQKAPQTANFQAKLSPLFFSDWLGVEKLLNQSVSQNPRPTPNDPTFNHADAALNLAQAQADLLTVIDSFSQGSSAVPFLLELVQVWSLSESCDLSQRANQSNLRLILNLAPYLTEIRESYNNYAFFLEQSELGGGAEYGR